MVNEIKGAPVNLVQTSPNSQSNRLANESGDQQSNPNSGSRSEVTITNTAETLRALEAEIQKQPVVDTQRVQAVKQAIFDGTFNLDSERTAQKMAEFENLMVSKSSSE